MRFIISSFLTSYFVSVIIVLLISYFGIRILTARQTTSVKKIILVLYIFLSVLFLGLQLYVFSTPASSQASRISFVLLVISLTLLVLVPIVFFSFLTLISLIFRWLGKCRTQLVILTGAGILSFAIFFVIAYGLFWGKYDIRTERYKLQLADLPKALDGIKIVQISDIHIGSFGQNQKILEEASKIIMEENPDLLFFTGDIVNNFGEELNGFVPYLKLFPAKYGKIAILGNHDYGDYSQWPDTISKIKNLDQIKAGLTDSGFDLLLNRWTKINISDTSIYVAGVENWGHSPFPQYARLDEALDSIPENSFKILLTHDPAHWKAKVVQATDISLTLSGHTHGGQFGVRIAGIEFSPIYFIQKTWGGLYKADNQFLYVNRGLGVIGFPGRIEMRPEITVLTLHRAKIH
ncbi:MAG: metallophosphoesterase [Prolixibacteraceae bacterium]|nr:metallophosphoesterase [Prolixibacteraceae bacterium]